jgi:transcriptional regulator with PAS, ATPase and Fis domain
VVAATNKNLREAVKEGAFRQDLYFRLNVIQIVLPPMRERPEDILPLAHDWPGNVRELRNAIERAMILEESAYITPSSLPNSITRPDGQPAAAAPRTEIPTEGLSLEDNERMLLARALEKTGGNQTQAARLLRITRDTLRYKMKKFNLR